MPTKLTSNQSRILRQLCDGHVPTGFSPRGIQSLEERGLVTRATGFYQVNRSNCVRLGISPGTVYRLTPAGVDALRDVAHTRHRAAIREADRELDAELQKLDHAEVVS